MTEESKIENNGSKTDQRLLSREPVRSSDDDHHMEFVDEVNGVAFINDARSTRLTASRNSLESIETSVVLIIGGDDAESDYSILAQQMKQKVVAVIYMGYKSDHILKHFSSHNLLFVQAFTIREAVKIASYYARSGDAVLFSPSCGHPENYKFRGTEFRSVVKSLKA
ncbi:MAG: hypothetical protein M3R27_02090 [Bacteroidota bacterium]|nr:hypothetical protein [Bacteroidota bacterium]